MKLSAFKIVPLIVRQNCFRDVLSNIFEQLKNETVWLSISIPTGHTPKYLKWLINSTVEPNLPSDCVLNVWTSI